MGKIETRTYNLGKELPNLEDYKKKNDLHKIINVFQNTEGDYILIAQKKVGIFLFAWGPL